MSASGTYKDARSYDSIGRLLDRTLTLPIAGSKSFDYSYDATTGFLDTLTYPASYPSTYRLVANYSYAWAMLKTISSGSTVWWTNNTQNIRGQITQETTEDASGDPQIVTSHNYDAVTGWVGSITTGVGGAGTSLQNESYLYDLVGNVTQRQNGNASLTESFYYDNVNRLDHSILGGTTNLQMVYDGGSNVPGPGNITQRSDVAGNTTWTYDPVRKHAVTQAGTGGYSYTYDANGNVSARAGTTFGWTSYNYPSSVGTSTESATFDYGADRQRWRMVSLDHPTLTATRCEGLSVAWEDSALLQVHYNSTCSIKQFVNRWYSSSDVRDAQLVKVEVVLVRMLAKD